MIPVPDPDRRARVLRRVLAESLGSLALLGLVVLALVIPFTLLLDGRTWLVPVLVTMLLVAGTGAASRGITLRSWPGWILQPVVALLATLTIGIPAASRWGPAPGPQTPPAVNNAIQNLVSALLKDVAPVQPIAEITAVAAGSAGLVLWALDLCCRGPRRAPALALPLMIAPAIAISFAIERPLGAVVVASACAAVVGLLFLPVRPVPWRRHRSALPSTGRGARGLAASLSSAVVVAAAALATAWVPSLVVPHPELGRFPEGARWITPGSFAGVDPLIDLSRDLRSPLSRTVIRYTAPAESSVYLRTNTISDLLADEWRPSVEGLTPYRDGQPLAVQRDPLSRLPLHAPTEADMAGTGYPVSALTGGDLDSWTGTTDYPDTSERGNGEGTTIGVDAFGYASPWLAVPQGALSVSGLTAGYKTQGTNGTLHEQFGETVDGGIFSAKVAAAPGRTALEDSPSVQEVVRTSLEVNGVTNDGGSARKAAEPNEEDRAKIPGPVRERADEVVAAAGADGEPAKIAAALRAYLTSRQFTYSEQAPVSTDGRSGGLSMVETFLRSKSGYCVHYASAMVLMARAEGIPARLAIGYSPGASTRTQATIAGANGTVFDVDSRNAHAWAELYFVNIGWVPFDPTPGRSGTSADAAVDPSATPTTPAPATPSSRPGTDPSIGGGNPGSIAPTSPTAGDTASAAHGGGVPGTPAAVPSWLPPALGGALGAGALVAGAVLVLRRRVARREATIRSGGPGAAQLAWLEAARAAGARRSAWERPTPEAAALWYPEGEAHDAAQRLAAAVDRELYAPRDTSPEGHGGAGLTPAQDAAAEAGARLGADLDLLRAEHLTERARRH